MKLWWHKLTHWEYWSVHIVYLPTFFLWIWFVIKFRTLRFYEYANPSIKNGGLYGEGKMDIYKLLPKNLYPKTIFVAKNEDKSFINDLELNQLEFPLIVKPDIGLRGIGVQKVFDKNDLLQYSATIQQDFLIQEVVTFSNEIGLFYYRIPTEKKGKISGITLKKFLIVEGNGEESIEQLLKKNPRFEMQIPKLKNQVNLHEILPKAQQICLVPFGNHNRGTEFLDGKEFITAKLTETFNNILDGIDGFYYGRLDIRYNTFEELEQGKNFSIIEINGAKSEPTQIYDSKYSFWNGQREIFRHQKIFSNIINTNLKLKV